jgi:murein L,D-transpeptidase YafK
VLVAAPLWAPAAHLYAQATTTAGDSGSRPADRSPAAATLPATVFTDSALNAALTQALRRALAPAAVKPLPVLPLVLTAEPPAEAPEVPGTSMRRARQPAGADSVRRTTRAGQPVPGNPADSSATPQARVARDTGKPPAGVLGRPVQGFGTTTTAGGLAMAMPGHRAIAPSIAPYVRAGTAAVAPALPGTPVAAGPTPGSGGAATAAATPATASPAPTVASPAPAPANGATGAPTATTAPPTAGDPPAATASVASSATTSPTAAAPTTTQPAATPPVAAPGAPASASGAPATVAAAPASDSAAGGTAAAAGAAAVLGTAAASIPTSTASAVPSAPAVLGRPVAGLAPDATRVDVGALFVRAQLTSTRVQLARQAADEPLHQAFTRAGMPYPPTRIYLRAFKREHELEVWAERPDGTYALVRTFSICSLGGSGLGPKLHRGDEQVPEGFYHVVDFNPASDYYLSLRLDYPNAADRARAGADANLGNDIYLHGGCRSAGCLPLTDAGIEQMYWLAVQVRANGQRSIPIDIFPVRLDAARWAQLSQAFATRPDLISFWSDLKQGYDMFERLHRLPDIAIDASGHYRVALVTH